MTRFTQLLRAGVIGCLALLVGGCGGDGECQQACAKLIQCFQQECAADPRPECAEVPTQSECETMCAKGWKWNNACLVSTDCAHINKCE
jgi:hypothetical protein